MLHETTILHSPPSFITPSSYPDPKAHHGSNTYYAHKAPCIMMLVSITCDSTLHSIRFRALGLFQNIIFEILVIVPNNVSGWVVFADDVEAGSF